MKKTLGFIFGLMLFITLGLAGCGGVYDDMEMLVLSDDEITIFIQDEITEQGQALVEEGNVEGKPIKYFLNTASIDVEISGVGSKVSKNILASSGDRTKLRIESIVLDDNVSTITLLAIQPGVVTVKIQSVEGGQVKNLKVNIVQVVDSISIASDYKFAVMANGTPQKFNESKIIQNPSNSNFSEFYYEAKEEVEGIIVSPNGYITATQKKADFVTIVIRPKYASSEAVFAEYKVPIFREIQESDLSFSLNSTVLESNEIEIIKNKEGQNTKNIILGVSELASSGIADEIKNLNVSTTILDGSIAVVLNSTNTSFDIVGVHTGRTTMKVKVTLKDFPNVEIFEKTYSIYVRDVATTISLTSPNSTNFNVYNLTSSNTLGVELIANVYPDTASSRKYTIQIPSEYSDKIKITNAYGTEYDLSSTLFSSGQKIYIYHDGTQINKTVTITLQSNDEESSASLNLTLNLHLYIESISTPTSDFLYIYDETSTENTYELEYELNPTEANKALVSIVSSNPNVLDVVYSQESGTHLVNLASVGKAKLYFYANGKLLKTANVEVVSQLKAMLTNVDSPAQNSSVSSRTRTSVVNSGVLVGQTTTNAVIKVGKKVKINISNYPETAKTASTEFSILAAKDENNNTISTTSVSIDDNGYVRSTTAITKFYVVVKSYGYVLDPATQRVVVNSEPLESIITFTAILPITDVSLNTVYKEIYDINSVGYAEAELAQTRLVLNVFPQNATVDTDAINWKVIGSNLNNILEVQSDGSALITGRLGSESGNQATITVRATIQEYDVVMSRECTIVIKKANQVSDILLDDYDSSKGAYLKYSQLQGNAFVPDTYQIQATTMPLDATNRGVDYFAFDIDINDISEFGAGTYTKVPSERIIVNRAGLVSTIPGGHGGFSIVYIVPRDNISEQNVFKENELKKYKILLFSVADGTQSNPFQISNIDDLLSMGNALDSYYVLANNINLAGISNFAPIGTVANPFVGHLSGKFKKTDNSYLYYSINNYNLNVEQLEYADISENDMLFGIFGCIGNDGVVEDLTITVSSIQISAVLKKDLIFGVVSAYNYGNISNCNVKIKGDIEFNLSALDGLDPAPQIVIGMLVGENQGTINDSNRSTNSTVVCENGCEITLSDYNNTTIQGFVPVSVGSTIGGLIGVNKGTVYGVFKYGGDLLDSNAQNYEVEFNVDYNESSVNSNVSLICNISNVSVGGVVGYNNSTIQYVSFAGSVSGVQNVGGVIGINNATASHLLSSGYISNSLNNVSIQNIGGVVGTNTSTGAISFAMFEVYETTTHINIQSTDVKNVGGVVGSNEGNIIYSYSYSYTAQKIDNTNFDIRVDATGITNVGGFAGYSNIDNTGIIDDANKKSISISFSNVAIHVNNLTSSVGNFAGSYAGNIKDCYFIGYINTKPPQIEQIKIGFDENNKDNWTAGITGRNYGLPMLKIENTNPSEVLLTEAPNSISITAKSDNTSSSSAKRFYKISDNQLILMLNNPSAQNNEDNTYAISSLISVSVVPLSNRTRSLTAQVFTGNSISIVGGNIIALSEGLSIVKIFSRIDPTECDFLEVYVVKGVTGIEVSNADSNNSIRTVKGQNIQLYTQNTNGTYQPLTRGGWYYTFNIADYSGYASFNYQNVVSSNVVRVSGEYMQLLSALEATTNLTDGYLEIIISPYVTAQFSDGTKNIVLDNIEYTLKLYIYQGLQGMTLAKTNEQIMPSADGLITVTLDTDLESDFISTISLYQSSIENKLGVYPVSASGVGSYNAEPTNSPAPKFTLELYSTSFDGSKRVIVFRLVPSRNIGDFEEPVNYIFEFVSENVQLDTTYKKQYDLTIYPQEIQSATIKYFNDSDDFDANLKGAGEIETNKIIIGQYGLVRINLHPIYSVYSKLTIESSAVSGEVASFQQVYFNSKEDNYAERVMGSTLIDSGITLIRVSNKYKDDSNKYITNFDGNIYVKVLIGSNVVSGQTVVFTLNAYDENENVIYTTNIRLITESLPYLTIDLTSGIYEGLVAKGTDFYANVRYEYGTTYSLEFYNSNGNPINNVDWVPTKTTLQNGIYTDLLQIHTNNLTLGEKYTIIAKITQSTGQDTKKIQVSTEFKVVNFVITGITLMLVDDNSNVETEAIVGGKFSHPLKNSGYNLKIRLITISDGSDAVNAQIAALETAINNRNVWQYFNLAHSQFESIIFSDKEFAKTNFRLVKIDEGGWTLIGNSIANVDTLKAVLTYNYGNGIAALANSALDEEYWQELSFELNFSISSSKEHPLPITTKEEFLGMQEGIDYILLEDIDFSNEVFDPISTRISSLDGNGKKITISSFDNEVKGSAINVGLFSEIDEDTIIKNVILQVKNDTSLDLSNYSEINFGYIAGVNYGTITNTEITSYYIDDGTNVEKPKYNTTITNSQSSQQSTIIAYIGGLVGSNYGVITNSRVSNIKITTSGTLGGFVALNNGIISSSYTNKVVLDSSAGDVGGFVAINYNSAKILTSYAKGEWVGDLLRADMLSINAIGNVGGFVHTNGGVVRDCYANLKLRSQSRSSGFVYNQNSTGNITNCISYCDIIQNSIAHMPFVGTGTNNRFQNQGTINNSFFYMKDDDVFMLKDIYNDESGAQHLSGDELSNPKYLSSFAFDDYIKGSGEDTEYNGVWVIPYKSSNVGTNSNANTTTGYQYFTTEKGFRSGIPELVDANIIAKSIKKLDRTEIMYGMPVYIYTYDNAKGAIIGTIENPYLIADVDDFIYCFENAGGDDFVAVNNVHARLIKNVSFSEYNQKLQTTRVEYSGIFNGNGLNLESISLSADVGYNGDNYGLFNKLGYLKNSSGNVVNRGVIKNLNVNFNEVKASQTSIVGGLVGVVDGGLLANINITGEDVAIKGSNIVGGVAGIVKGSAHLFNVHSEVSANAGYRNVGYKNDISYYPIVYFDDSEYANINSTEYKSENRELSNSIKYVSYAGAVAGVVDTKIRDNYQESLRYASCYDISVSGDVKIIASTAGGVFGLVGVYTKASNVRFEVENDQFINGEKIQGGVVGELRGTLEQSYIAHNDIVQSVIDASSYGLGYDRANTTLFKENSKTEASGGLVGFNFGGSIINCYAKVDVRNKLAQSAGGLVGASMSGDIRAVFASGSVTGYSNIGGLIGELISVIGINVFYFANYVEIEPNVEVFRSYIPLEMSAREGLSDLNVSLIKFPEDSDDTFDKNTMTISYIVAGNNWYAEDIAYNSASTRNWGGIIGYYPNTLTNEYISTIHPADPDEEDNLINFYVASKNGSSNQFIYGDKGGYLSGAVGNEDLYIASAIAYDDLKYANKETYFGSWHKYTWDLTNTGKFPIISPKVIPAEIEVSTVSDLIQVMWKLDGNYILTNDIDLKSIRSWLPLGTEQSPFCGTFTSQVKSTTKRNNITYTEYYTIKNLSILANYHKYYGLFGYTGIKETIRDNNSYYSQCKITNINITVKKIDSIAAYTNEVYVGALVACSNGTKIENCTVSNSTLNNVVSPGITTNASYTGGLVGYSTISQPFNGYIEGSSLGMLNNAYFTSTISNCASKVDIYINNPSHDFEIGQQPISYVGGLVGYVYSETNITKSWSSQKIEFIPINDRSSKVIAGGFIGSNKASNDIEKDSKISESFSSSDVVNESVNSNTYFIMGGFIGELYSGLRIDHCFSSGKFRMVGAGSSSPISLTLGGFVGKLNSLYGIEVDSVSQKNIMSNYSISTFENFVENANLGGFVADYSDVVSSLGELIENNANYKNYYDLSLAMLENEGILFSTAEEINNAYSGDIVWSYNNSSLKLNNYYPLLKNSVGNTEVVLGNERIDIYAFDAFRSGSKVNPILIQDLNGFKAMVGAQETMYLQDNFEYNYYLQVGANDGSGEKLDISLENSNIFIEHFYGFYNGSNNTISNFTLTSSKDSDEKERYNIGLFGELLQDSVISCLSLKNANIEIASSAKDPTDTDTDDSVLNVGCLVGLANENSTLFAISVDLNSAVTVVPYGNAQTVNIGGIAGYTNETRVIYCISYANVASFDYRTYNNINVGDPLEPRELNMGSIVGLYKGSSDITYKVLNVFSIGELHYTNGQTTNIGNLIGKVENTIKLQNFYSANTVFNMAQTLAPIVGDYNVSGSSNSVLEYNKISTSFDANTDFSKNYGYDSENFGILRDNIPTTAEDIDTKKYYYVITAPQLAYLLNVDKESGTKKGENVLIQKDIFFNGEEDPTISRYDAILEGNKHTIFNLSGSMFNNLYGSIKNVEIKKSTDPNVSSNLDLIAGTVDTTATITNVNAPDFNIPSLSNNSTLYNFKNQNSSNVSSESNKWVNLSGDNGLILRDFAEYWDEMDLRCVYIRKDTIVAENQNGQDTNVLYYGINDKYQLSKLLYYSCVASSYIDSDMKYAIKCSNNYDFAGKIWKGFAQQSGVFKATFKGINDDFSNNIITIKNIYTEGISNVGFISSSSDAIVTNIYFEGSKSVAYDPDYDPNDSNYTPVEYSNFGAVIANASRTYVSDIQVKGVDMDLANVNFVGSCFGTFDGIMNNISAKTSSTKTQIRGANYVGGIAGKFVSAKSNDVTQSADFNNDYEIFGHDAVGGFFGALIYGVDSDIVSGNTTLADIGSASMNNDPTFNYNNGVVNGNNYVGGIVGYSNLIISNFVNNGAVNASGYFAGGISGYNAEIIYNCYNYKPVTFCQASYNNIANVTFDNSATAEINLSEINSDFTNTTIKEGYFYGGISGVNTFYIFASRNFDEAQISAKSFVGGIVGLNTGTVTGKMMDIYRSFDMKTVNSSNVSGSSFVGGIAGYNNSEAKIDSVVYNVRNLPNTIHALAYVGGIVGYNNGWVLNTFTQNDDVNSIALLNALYIGGIAGYNAAAGFIQSANSEFNIKLSGSGAVDTANVLLLDGMSTYYSLGGISAQNDGIITMCAVQQAKYERESGFTANKVNIGGITAINNGKVELSFVDNASSITFFYGGSGIVEPTAQNNLVRLGGAVALNGSSNNSTAEVVSTYSLAPVAASPTNPSGYQVIIGGLVAENFGLMQDSYALDSVYGSSSVTIDYAVNALYFVQNDGSSYQLPSNNDILGGYKSFIEANFEVSSIRPWTNDENNRFEKSGNMIQIPGIEHYISSLSVWSGYTQGAKLRYAERTFEVEPDYEDYMFEEVESISGTKYKLKDNFVELNADQFDKYICGNLNVDYFVALSRSYIFFHSWTGNPMPVQNNNSSGSNTVVNVSDRVSSGFVGEGTENNPYLIYGVRDLNTINYYLEHCYKSGSRSERENFSDKYFKLVNDIVLSSANYNVIIGSEENPFAGTINGAGHTIENMNFNDSSADNVGMFGVLKGTVKNLIFMNPTIVGANNVGVVAGTNKGSIENVKVVSTQSTSKVSGVENVGGVCGLNASEGRIIQCQVSIDVSGTTNVGSICGLNNNLVDTSETLSIVGGTMSTACQTIGVTNVGGIAGYNAKEISQCACTNIVIGESNVGGIAGCQIIDTSSGGVGGIIDCLFAGAVSSKYDIYTDNNNNKLGFAGIVGNCQSGSVERVICAGLVGGLGNGSGEIYCNKQNMNSSNLIVSAATTGPSDDLVNNDATKLSVNQMMDIARRAENFSGFNISGNNSTWGLVVNKIDAGLNDYSSDYGYSYPLLKNLPSSENLPFSYAIFNGGGTEENPYYIENQDQFGDFISYVNNDNIIVNGRYYKIDVNVYKNTYNNKITNVFNYDTWTPTADWKCILDGNGATLNLGTISVPEGTEHYCAFISRISGSGRIKNLELNIGIVDIFKSNDSTDPNYFVPNYDSNLYCGGVAGVVTGLNYECTSSSHTITNVTIKDTSDPRLFMCNDIGNNNGYNMYIGKYVGCNATENNDNHIVS